METDNSFFTVGELSDITGVSKQAIRYYDRIGLLKPDKVDSQNSYRYYRPMHILYLNTITRLSQLGCSLKEIRTYISGGDIKHISSMLEIRRSLTEKKITELNNALRTLEQQISIIEQGSSAKSCAGVVLKDLPLRCFAYDENPVEPSLKQGILQINRMVRKMEEHGMLFVCSPVFEYIKGRKLFRTGFFYDEMPDPALFPADAVPQGTYACAYHRGKYDRMPQTAEKLYKYIELNHLEAKSNLFQLYLIDYALTQNEDEHLTELQIRIR